MANDPSFFNTKRLRQSFWHRVRLPVTSSSDTKSLGPRPATEATVRNKGSRRQVPCSDDGSNSREKEPQAKDTWKPRGASMRGIHVSYPKSSSFEHLSLEDIFASSKRQEKALSYLDSDQISITPDLKTLVTRWFHKEEAPTQVASLQGNDAQIFQNFLDRISKSEEQGSELDMQCQRFMAKISRTSGKVPSSLLIDGLERSEELPYTGGGFSDVYRGNLKGQKVAIKALRIFAFPEEAHKVYQDCYAEALVWRRLSHRHILPFIGLSTNAFQRRLSLISPWMEHGNIREYLHENSKADPYRLLSQVAEGLEYLHSAHFYHGDIKSANILINENQEACLGDMGLTTISATRGLSSASMDNASGTPRWMAPELFVNQPRFTYESDVYAFGMTIYEVISGKLPFQGLREFAVISVVISGQRPNRPEQGESAFPFQDPLWNLVQCCWKQEASTRYKMPEVVSTLKDIIAPSPLIVP